MGNELSAASAPGRNVEAWSEARARRVESELPTPHTLSLCHGDDPAQLINGIVVPPAAAAAAAAAAATSAGAAGTSGKSRSPTVDANTADDDDGSARSSRSPVTESSFSSQLSVLSKSAPPHTAAGSSGGNTGVPRTQYSRYALQMRRRRRTEDGAHTGVDVMAATDFFSRSDSSEASGSVRSRSHSRSSSSGGRRGSGSGEDESGSSYDDDDKRSETSCETLLTSSWQYGAALTATPYCTTRPRGRRLTCDEAAERRRSRDADADSSASRAPALIATPDPGTSPAAATARTNQTTTTTITTANKVVSSGAAVRGSGERVPALTSSIDSSEGSKDSDAAKWHARKKSKMKSLLGSGGSGGGSGGATSMATTGHCASVASPAVTLSGPLGWGKRLLLRPASLSGGSSRSSRGSSNSSNTTDGSRDSATAAAGPLSSQEEQKAKEKKKTRHSKASPSTRATRAAAASAASAEAAAASSAAAASARVAPRGVNGITKEALRGMSNAELSKLDFSSQKARKVTREERQHIRAEVARRGGGCGGAGTGSQRSLASAGSGVGFGDEYGSFLRISNTLAGADDLCDEGPRYDGEHRLYHPPRAASSTTAASGAAGPHSDDDSGRRSVSSGSTGPARLSESPGGNNTSTSTHRSGSFFKRLLSGNISDGGSSARSRSEGGDGSGNGVDGGGGGGAGGREGRDADKPHHHHHQRRREVPATVSGRVMDAKQPYRRVKRTSSVGGGHNFLQGVSEHDFTDALPLRVQSGHPYGVSAGLEDSMGRRGSLGGNVLHHHGQDAPGGGGGVLSSSFGSFFANSSTTSSRVAGGVHPQLSAGLDADTDDDLDGDEAEGLMLRMAGAPPPTATARGAGGATPPASAEATIAAATTAVPGLHISRGTNLRRSTGRPIVSPTAPARQDSVQSENDTGEFNTAWQQQQEELQRSIASQLRGMAFTPSEGPTPSPGMCGQSPVSNRTESPVTVASNATTTAGAAAAPAAAAVAALTRAHHCHTHRSHAHEARPPAGGRPAAAAAPRHAGRVLSTSPASPTDDASRQHCCGSADLHSSFSSSCSSGSGGTVSSASSRDVSVSVFTGTTSRTPRVSASPSNTAVTSPTAKNAMAPACAPAAMEVVMLSASLFPQPPASPCSPMARSDARGQQLRLHATSTATINDTATTAKLVATPNGLTQRAMQQQQPQQQPASMLTPDGAGPLIKCSSNSGNTRPTLADSKDFLLRPDRVVGPQRRRSLEEASVAADASKATANPGVGAGGGGGGGRGGSGRDSEDSGPRKPRSRSGSGAAKRHRSSFSFSSESLLYGKARGHLTRAAAAAVAANTNSAELRRWSTSAGDGGSDRDVLPSRGTSAYDGAGADGGRRGSQHRHHQHHHHHADGDGASTERKRTARNRQHLRDRSVSFSHGDGSEMASVVAGLDELLLEASHRHESANLLGMHPRSFSSSSSSMSTAPLSRHSSVHASVASAGASGSGGSGAVGSGSVRALRKMAAKARDLSASSSVDSEVLGREGPPHAAGSAHAGALRKGPSTAATAAGGGDGASASPRRSAGTAHASTTTSPLLRLPLVGAGNHSAVGAGNHSAVGAVGTAFVASSGSTGGSAGGGAMRLPCFKPSAPAESSSSNDVSTDRPANSGGFRIASEGNTLVTQPRGAGSLGGGGGAQALLSPQDLLVKGYPSSTYLLKQMRGPGVNTGGGGGGIVFAPGSLPAHSSTNSNNNMMPKPHGMGGYAPSAHSSSGRWLNSAAAAAAAAAGLTASNSTSGGSGGGGGGSSALMFGATRMPMAPIARRFNVDGSSNSGSGGSSNSGAPGDAAEADTVMASFRDGRGGGGGGGGGGDGHAGPAPPPSAATLLAGPPRDGSAKRRRPTTQNFTPWSVDMSCFKALQEAQSDAA